MKSTRTRFFPFTLILIVSAFLMMSCNDCDDGMADVPDEPFGPHFIMEDGVYKEVVLSHNPYFNEGGRQGMLECIYRKIKYLSEAIEYGLEGVVVLEFEIDEGRPYCRSTLD